MKMCSVCGLKNNRATQNYCAKCYAEYLAIFKEKPPFIESRLTHEDRVQFLKVSVRKFTAKLVMAGIIKKTPCEVCENKDAEIHHMNYLHPLEIRWLCSKHHAELHAKEKKTNNFGISPSCFD